jgi:hydroxymethylbilane synthase
MKNKIIIGSRESKLAVIQSEQVRDFLKKTNPDMEVEILTMKTTGDKILDRTLDKVGGKGLFVKELDRALIEGRSDLSVHSLKDMPMEVSSELPLLAFSKREDPRDVLVLPEGAKELDQTKPLGCSSRRRALQLKALYPEMEVRSIRGNLQTRLRKLEEDGYAGLVLAAAGLKRLGLEHRIARYFTEEEILPAAGQGILAVQGRAGEDYGYLNAYNDPEAAAAAAAERSFVRELDGGCSSPIAAYAQIEGDTLTLRGLYYIEATEVMQTEAPAEPDANRLPDPERILCEGRSFIGSLSGSVDQAEQIGIALARTLKKKAENGMTACKMSDTEDAAVEGTGDSNRTADTKKDIHAEESACKEEPEKGTQS